MDWATVCKTVASASGFDPLLHHHFFWGFSANGNTFPLHGKIKSSTLLISIFFMNDEKDIVYRLKKRAEIRRQISSRKSVQEGKPDRIADLLEEAAEEIEKLRKGV